MTAHPAKGIREAPGASVLVVDDEESFHRTVAKYLNGYRRITAYTGWQGLEALGKHHIDLVLLDLNLPDATGFQVLEQIRRERDDVEVIVCTAHSEIRNAVDAVKLGAFDFLVKSYENYQNLSEHVRRALEHRRNKRAILEARTESPWLREAFSLLEDSRSEQMQLVGRLARRVAETPLTVLIEGESGVGKEILARYIHAWSDRADKPFVALNAAAVPGSLLGSYWFGHVKGAFTGADRNQIGKFELANGGTLFLDEIGELDAEAQVKLLRVLQEREVERLGANEATPVDVRVLAATNKQLSDEVKAGRFREDLYFRLNVLHLTLPPLRDRTDDLPRLTALLLDKHAATMNRDAPAIAPDALEVLQRHDWPGNVRELENLMMRLVAFSPGGEIRQDDIPIEYWLPLLNQTADEQREDAPRVLALAVQQFERYFVRLMIRRCEGNRRKAAQALGVSYTTLKQKLREDREERDPGDESSGRAGTLRGEPPAGTRPGAGGRHRSD